MLHCKNSMQGRTKIGHSGCFRRFPVQFAVAAVLAVVPGVSIAQTPVIDSPKAPAPPASSFIVDPQAEREGDKIKQQTWRSAPAGQQGNWNLDVGHFKEDKADEQDLRDRISDDVQAYSGMRLRLPLKGSRQ